MCNGPRNRVLFFLLTFQVLWFKTIYGQISDTLYQLIPVNYKPKDRSALTVDEKRRIVKYAQEFLWPDGKKIGEELERLALGLEREAEESSDLNLKILNYSALGDYYQFFKDRESGLGNWVPYYKKVIHLAGQNPQFNKQVAYAYLGIAIYRVQQSKYEEASELLNQSLLRFTQVGDTVGISSVHAYYYPLYSSLHLYNQAIHEQNLSLQFITAIEKERGLDKYYAYENYQDKALTYLCWYELERDKKLLDSADSYINRTPLIGHEADQWRPTHYFLVGYRAFLGGNYKRALQYFDSSLTVKEYYAELKPAKIIYKGISLLKLGRSKEAKMVLLDPSLFIAEHYLRQIAYEALYQDALDHKNYPEAIRFHEISNRFKDSTALITQRGKVFEVMQKYSVMEKEIEIKSLEIINAKKEQQRNTLVWIFVITGVSMLLVIIGLYTIGRARKVKTLEAEALLEKERRNKEDIIRLQERDLQRTRKRVISSLRKKISRDLHDELSSSLAGLKYYVNDLRLKETKDENKSLLKDIEQEIDGVYKQARAYMHNLNTGIEEAVSKLTPFLQNISKDLSQKSGLDIRLKYDKTEVESKLSPNQQHQLTLMLKEATSNILKHSGATLIEIAISFSDGNCNFSISDNGRGFSGETLEKGLGMDSMELRIRRIKGRISMQSSSSGTKIEGFFPVS